MKAMSFDARKVVKYINESAQSNISTIGRLINKLGQKVGKNYNLVAVKNKNLMFEDVDTNTYYIADYVKDKGSKITLKNITKIIVKESKKEHVYHNACTELVDALSEDRAKDAEIAFKKLDACKFRPTVASSDGFVTTKDGVRRMMNVIKPIEEDSIHDVAKVIVESLKDEIKVENGDIVSAVVGEVEPEFYRASDGVIVTYRSFLQCKAEG